MRKANTVKPIPSSADITADQFIELLENFSSPAERKKMELILKTDDQNKKDMFMGVRMGEIFSLAKEFINMRPVEIEKLLKSSFHEARVGAVSIMDWQARDKKTTKERRKELFDLYITRHNRIDHWGMVDRSAPYVVGGYLFDKPRTTLYKLARSRNPMERRTAIVSTYFFIRQGDVADTFKIAEILVNDDHDLIQKATGSWIREAGKKDQTRLLNFLDKHAATMPRTTLRYAIEHLDSQKRKHYLNLKLKNTSKK